MKNRFLFVSISEYGLETQQLRGSLGSDRGMMLSGVIFLRVLFFGFTICWSIKKLMRLFVINFKNKYVLTLSDNCGFFRNCYNAGGGLSYEEMNR